jgi:hypothetical protein
MIIRSLCRRCDGWFGSVRSSRVRSFDFAIEINLNSICFSMAHDVYISHAHKDRGVAVAICKKLESVQVRCWIAQRDIPAGEDWIEAIRNAIASSRVMVLLLSENANVAPHIEREITHAFYTKCAILPVRLTDTPPKRDFLFYLGNVPWFDAFNSPPEQHLEELAASVNGIVRGHTVARDTKLPHRMADNARKLPQYSDSWMGALRASHYGSLEILKRIAIAASLLTAVWLLWFVYSQTKHEESLPEGDTRMMNSPRGAATNLTPKDGADSAVSKPSYIYTRLGLWVSSSARPTPSPEERASLAQSITASAPSASAAPSPDLEVDQEATNDQAASLVRHDISAMSVSPQSPGIAGQTTTVAAGPGQTQKNEAAAGDTEPENPEDTIQIQAEDPLPSPSAAPSMESIPPETPSGGLETPSRGSLQALDEQSLKELVLEYLHTMATDDGSTLERLFAGRVNFYGKGVLSLSEIGASMERYRRQWPIGKWEPKGEPEFPNNLHSFDPDQYEVLQPFDWTVANGSKHKRGSAILYLRVRKAENGAFHIFHLEQRHL